MTSIGLRHHKSIRDYRDTKNLSAAIINSRYNIIRHISNRFVSSKTVADFARSVSQPVIHIWIHTRAVFWWLYEQVSIEVFNNNLEPYVCENKNVTVLAGLCYWRYR